MERLQLTEKNVDLTWQTSTAIVLKQSNATPHPVNVSVKKNWRDKFVLLLMIKKIWLSLPCWGETRAVFMGVDAGAHGIFILQKTAQHNKQLHNRSYLPHTNSIQILLWRKKKVLVLPITKRFFSYFFQHKCNNDLIGDSGSNRGMTGRYNSEWWRKQRAREREREREREKENRDWMMTIAYWVITRRGGHNRGCKTQNCRAHCRFQNRSSFEILCFTHKLNQIKWSKLLIKPCVLLPAEKAVHFQNKQFISRMTRAKRSRTTTAYELDFDGEKSSIPFLARALFLSPSLSLGRWRWAKQQKPNVIAALFVDEKRAFGLFSFDQSTTIQTIY